MSRACIHTLRAWNSSILQRQLWISQHFQIYIWLKYTRRNWYDSSYHNQNKTKPYDIPLLTLYITERFIAIVIRFTGYRYNKRQQRSIKKGSLKIDIVQYESKDASPSFHSNPATEVGQGSEIPYLIHNAMVDVSHSRHLLFIWLIETVHSLILLPPPICDNYI